MKNGGISAVSSEVEPGKPRLLDRLRDRIRLKHYSLRTEQSYADWAKRYIFVHNKRHPLEMGAAEVASFLTHLAVERRVSASTQNQALNALVLRGLEEGPGRHRRRGPGQAALAPAAGADTGGSPRGARRAAGDGPAGGAFVWDRDAADGRAATSARCRSF